MSPEFLAIIGIVAFLLATGLLVLGLMAFWSNSSRQARREEYRPPHYDDGSGGDVRFGSVDEPPQLEGRQEADPIRKPGGIVWGNEEVSEPARPVRIRTPKADEGSTKCPTCLRPFSETPDQIVLRCAKCRTLVHQDCKDLTGDCPICHGTQLSLYR